MVSPTGLGVAELTRIVGELADKMRAIGATPECVVVDGYGHFCLDCAESVVGLPVKVREWAHGAIHVMSTDDFTRRDLVTQHSAGHASGQT